MARGGVELRGLRLLKLMLQCMKAVAMDHLVEACDLLPEISKLASPFSSSLECISIYFAEALCSRIMSSFLGAYSPLTLKSPTLAQNQRIAQAFQAYNSIAPLVQFSHFTANQAIFDALDGKDLIHVVDLNIMQGLFHILASCPDKIRSICITGLGSSLELLEDTVASSQTSLSALGSPLSLGSRGQDRPRHQPRHLRPPRPP